MRRLRGIGRGPRRGLLGVVEEVDIVFFPVAMDFKKTDVEAMADGGYSCRFINGAVRTSEQGEMAELLRRKSQIVVAYGACALPGWRAWTRKPVRAGRRLLRYVYEESPSR